MILAIESSCDESALALFDPSTGMAGEWVHTQIAMHEPYGGVVPDVASREHLRQFPRLLDTIAGHLVTPPNAIAVTCGPGLPGCLALGISLAKSLAVAWSVPLTGVNHLRGHAFSPFIGLHAESPKDFAERFRASLPHLGLIVSGGNTLLFHMDVDESTSGNTLGDVPKRPPAVAIRVIAQTVDDAAGEALDKGAKLLGLGYPGGPLIEKLAAGRLAPNAMRRAVDAWEMRAGNRKAIAFPRAFHDSSELKFSFSGLKTSLRYRLEDLDDGALRAAMPDICASYQEAVVDALCRKVTQALRKNPAVSLGLSGGVANNGRLRERFAQLATKARLPLFVAEPRHTGDNAAMIGFAAWADPSGVCPDHELDLSFDPALALARG